MPTDSTGIERGENPFGASHQQKHAEPCLACFDERDHSIRIGKRDDFGCGLDGSRPGVVRCIDAMKRRVGHDNNLVAGSEKLGRCDTQVTTGEASSTAPGMHCVEHEQRAGESNRTGLKQAIDDDRVCVVRRRQEGSFAARTDPDLRGPVCERASHQEGVISDLFDAVARRYHANASRKGLVAMGDDRDPPTSLRQGLGARHNDWRFS
jgi:hypothetical protein